MSRIAPISGFPEYSPTQRIVEQRFLDVIRETFELHGFASIETRSIEPVERLRSQGEDADKEIYGVARLAGGEDPRWGLHFDLTVPFARYVLENSGTLEFPFRRYQIQKSWRGERPQEGRYREFTQADIDVVDLGSLAPHIEAELPLVLADVFARFPIGDFVIRVNNRKVANGFYAGLGIEDLQGTLRAVDKLDKIGPEAVRALLLGRGLSAEQAQQCLRLAQINSADDSFVAQVRDLGVANPLLDEGLADLARVVSTAAAHAPGKVVADLKIARGLDYYTGTVYEVQIRGREDWGTIAAGGRYDALATDGKLTYPGVGLSIGVTRILGLLFGAGAVTATRSTPSAVLVAVNDEADRDHSTAVATALRARGIACEVAPRAEKFGKQIRYADRRGIPFVWFPRSDGDQVKDIRSGAQVAADPASWSPPAEDLRAGLVITP
ncbi:histidine--tRNA ligase [Nostocoides sp.]|uniref:histidine--tRNA ligase n=1 Tax=Nostocoides sp. TaxID=1917966 RepID=UPI002CB32145|nr:histidine--tRNA ligase [Tetrasphaera sp.]